MIRRFWQDCEGAVFVLAAAGMMMLVSAVGVALDVGRGQMAQTKLQNALDAAGLAAGASVNSTDLEAEILKYMQVNFTQGTLGATITDIDPQLSDDGLLLRVTARASMPTSVMRIFGHDTMELKAYTEVTRTSKGMELAMVLDITGSMCDPSCAGRLDALKVAAKDLLEILFGTGKTTAENLWIGIVPFSMGVNTGTSHTDWLNSTHFAGLDWGTTSWRGCTEARWTAGRDLTDATPAAEKFLAYYWPDDSNNDWRGTGSNTVTNSLCGPTSSNSCRCTTSSGGTHTCGCSTSGNVTTCISCSGSGNSKKCKKDVTTSYTTYSINSTQGPNTYCPASEVTRLTNNRTTLESGINGLTAVGGTHIPEGAVWGWRMLSPLWRGLWGGSMNTNNLPLDYNTDLMIKAMILMTDGRNTMYSYADGSYGYTQQNHVGMTSTPYTDGAAALKLDGKLTAICNNMKAKGIIIYTVVFDLKSSDVDTLMRNCASQPDFYFNTPDAVALKQAFRTIGDSLANLRISK